MSHGGPRGRQRPPVVALTVSYNTRELTALLLWSLRAVLEWPTLEIVAVDNASTDGSAELLAACDRAGLCRAVLLDRNVGHGPGLNEGLRQIRLAAPPSTRVWILDSDCVVARPDALAVLFASAARDAAIVGESHWDPWNERSRFELYSLLVALAATGVGGVEPFTAGGDPSLAFLDSARAASLELAEFPFTADGFVIHLGRGSLAEIVRANHADHELYAWAVDHHEPHFGGVAGAATRYAELVERFRNDVGPPNGEHFADNLIRAISLAGRGES